MSRLWMLWPPHRRRMRVLDMWCQAHRKQILELAQRVAQLGYTIGPRA